jgi:pimeloyl-ACP methyl ester carboxylesterase
MALEQKRVALGNGIELDVVDEGPRDAPVLIFLHGFPESHRTWRHQIAHFADRFRCIAPDQRGYRGSSKPQGISDYTPDKLVGDILLLAAALDVKDFTVVGHDWGGAIAWGVALAGQDTGRVTRAIIANAPHPQVFQKLLYTSRVQREASQYMRGFRDPANDALVRDHGLGGILMQEIKWDAPDKMEPEERAKLLEDWQDRDAAFGMLNWYRASPIDIPPMDAPFETPEGWTLPALPKLRIPTLVIWAQDDLALPPENTEGMAEFVEDFTLVEVPDCGHFVPWEAPLAVNEAIERFLDQTA